MVDWIDAALALPQVVLVALLVRLVGLRRTSTLLLRQSEPVSGILDTPDVERWMARTIAIRRVAGRLPDAACLVRSIALAWWMRRSGLAAEVVAGMPTGPRREFFEAGHAWVVLGAHRFDDPPHAPDRFVPIDVGAVFGSDLAVAAPSRRAGHKRTNGT
jgi:hypothetical protein